MTENFQIRKPIKLPTNYERVFNVEELKKILLDYMRQNGADMPEGADWKCLVFEDKYEGRSGVVLRGDVLED